MTVRSAIPRAVLVLAVALGICTAAPEASAAAGGSANSDAARASQINIRGSDLAKLSKWSSSPTPPSEVVLGNKAVLCMKSGGGVGGNVSPDPFGTVGKSSGDVTADVSSRVFAAKGSLTGLPSASSEVVFVKSAQQAQADLTALRTNTVRSCITSLMVAVIAKSSGGKAEASTTSLASPRLGASGASLHFRFAVTGVNIPGKLYEDVYYVVEGRAEIALTFVNIAAPFSSTWAEAIARTIVGRATSIVG